MILPSILFFLNSHSIFGQSKYLALLLLLTKTNDKISSVIFVNLLNTKIHFHVFVILTSFILIFHLHLIIYEMKCSFVIILLPRWIIKNMKNKNKKLEEMILFLLVWSFIIPSYDLCALLFLKEEKWFYKII